MRTGIGPRATTPGPEMLINPNRCPRAEMQGEPKVAHQSSEGQMPTGAMEETPATVKAHDTENLGDVWRATAFKTVTESAEKKIPEDSASGLSEQPTPMPGE